MALAFDVTINGQGLSDYGLFGGSVDGLGITTYGLIWSCGSIWDSGEPDVTTTWAACEVPANVEDCID